MLRSGMGPPSFCNLKHLMDAESGLLAVCDRVYNLAASVHAIAAGKVMRVPGMHGFWINHNASVLKFQIGNLLQEVESALLPERLDDHANVEPELTAGHWNIVVTSSRVFG